MVPVVLAAVEAWWPAADRGAGPPARADANPQVRPAPQRRRAHTGVRVLVVDDEREVRQMLRLALEDLGYEVREAADGVEALGVVRVWRPDAIVLDLLMPAMNGWQFAEAYRRQQDRLGERHAPVIAITAAGPAAIRAAEALDTISAVLTKPLDIDDLSETIERHAGGERPV